MKALNLNQTVYSATQKYPELIKVIADLGYPQIRNNFMRNTLGKNFTLNQAISKAGLDKEKMINLLTSMGFSIV